MIRVQNGSTDSNWIQSWNLDQIGSRVIHQMSEADKEYSFRSPEQLHFEVTLRSNIVKASYALNRTDAAFATFAEARCNPRFWDLTPRGGFQLREEVTPAEGIRDIFVHGYEYAFECATAMVIVLYKAMLDTIPEVLFNHLFADLLLYDGNYDHDLKLESVNEERSLPGDIRYFRNPDVDPREIQWQGENAVDLGDGTFYGHGIGITTAPRIIYHLNRHRKPGASTSAYLTDDVLQPDYKRLFRLIDSVPVDGFRGEELVADEPLKQLITIQIGSTFYIRC